MNVIRIVYYNSKNRQIENKFKEIRNSWELKQFNIDEEWIKLN